MAKNFLKLTHTKQQIENSENNKQENTKRQKANKTKYNYIHRHIIFK